MQEDPEEPFEPEAVVEHLRKIRLRIAEVTPLTPRERRLVRGRGRTTNPILQASINMISAHDAVARAVAEDPEEVRRLNQEADRWTAVADELRGMLKGVEGANLIRRERLALITTLAYNVGKQLVRHPANLALLPYVMEIKRLKGLARRKRRGDAPPSTEEPLPGDGDPQP
jgi:hypothetical protein